MPDYAKKLRRVPANPLRASVTSDKLTPKEVTQFRSALGQMAWPATNLRPDLAAECSMLLSTTLEEERKRIEEDTKPDDAHKVLHTAQAAEPKKKPDESLNWLLQRVAKEEAEACEQLVYKTK